MTSAGLLNSAARERLGMEDLNMADMAQGALFILACAFLYGLTVFLFRDQIKSIPRRLAIDLDQPSDFSRREYAGYLCNFMGENNVSSCSIRRQAEPRN
jgi:hypothetical protein